MHYVQTQIINISKYINIFFNNKSLNSDFDDDDDDLKFNDASTRWVICI